MTLDFTFTADNKVQLWADELDDWADEGIYKVLDYVRKEAITHLRNRYQNEPQFKDDYVFGGGLSMQTSGELGNIINQWHIEQDSNGARLIWNGAGGSEASTGEVWSKVYYVDTGTGPRKGADSAYDEPTIGDSGLIRTDDYRRKYKSEIVKDDKTKTRQFRLKGKDSRTTPREAETIKWRERGGEGFNTGAGDMGAFRSAIQAWAAEKRLDLYWTAIANKIAEEGILPANPDFSVDLFGMPLGTQGVTVQKGSLISQWIEEGIDKHLTVPDPVQEDQVVEQELRVIVDIRGKVRLAKGSPPVTISGTTYFAGNWLPEGLKARYVAGAGGEQVQRYGTWFRT